MTQPCRHDRVEVIAQDTNGKFVECLDCREIFEAEELDELASQAKRKSEHQEDLSDA